MSFDFSLDRNEKGIMYFAILTTQKSEFSSYPKEALIHEPPNPGKVPIAHGSQNVQRIHGIVVVVVVVVVGSGAVSSAAGLLLGAESLLIGGAETPSESPARKASMAAKDMDEEEGGAAAMPAAFFVESFLVVVAVGTFLNDDALISSLIDCSCASDACVRWWLPFVGVPAATTPTTPKQRQRSSPNISLNN